MSSEGQLKLFQLKTSDTWLERYLQPSRGSPRVKAEVKMMPRTDQSLFTVAKVLNVTKFQWAPCRNDHREEMKIIKVAHTC